MSESQRSPDYGWGTVILFFIMFGGGGFIIGWNSKPSDRVAQTAFVPASDEDRAATCVFRSADMFVGNGDGTAFRWLVSQCNRNPSLR